MNAMAPFILTKIFDFSVQNERKATTDHFDARVAFMNQTMHDQCFKFCIEKKQMFLKSAPCLILHVVLLIHNRIRHDTNSENL